MIRIMLNMLFMLTFLCCNTSSKQKDLNSNEIHFTNPNHDLVERATSFYKEKKYSEALLCFDSLINVDSTNGEYYFKRGFCKSMQSDNEVGAIEDFLKAIEF